MASYLSRDGAWLVRKGQARWLRPGEDYQGSRFKVGDIAHLPGGTEFRITHIADKDGEPFYEGVLGTGGTRRVPESQLR